MDPNVLKPPAAVIMRGTAECCRAFGQRKKTNADKFQRRLEIEDQLRRELERAQKEYRSSARERQRLEEIYHDCAATSYGQQALRIALNLERHALCAYMRALRSFSRFILDGET